ncbi:MAG TPA: hypothetical protein VMU19_15780 [Bryobacteraceae bacterium]|nr:hypothetical protein [Bryobacteraceae bacterium]
MTTTQSRLSLPELRRRTDRELIILAGRAIERSLHCVNTGAYAEAHAAFLQAELLVRLANGSRKSDVEARVEHMRAILNRREPAFRACQASC